MSSNDVAIYCRLSKEDENKGLYDNSDSIENQKKLLTNYAHEQGWQIYDYYIDDDFKGSDRNRPDFNRMISDLVVGPPKIVLCKKQARFARDIELVEKYVHGIFLEKNIRFIALLDNIDTQNANSSTRRSSQINSLVDEWYLSDLSDNVTASLKVLQQEGKFIGSYAPYGYKKDPDNKHHLIVDSEAAVQVKWIFHSYVYEGVGIHKITQYLNLKGIPNPYAYKRSKGAAVSVGSRKTPHSDKWSDATVYYILTNPVYLGHIVQGKFKKPNYKSKKLIRLPEDQWCVVEHCHEPLVDKATWEGRKQRAKERHSGGRKPNLSSKHPLMGKVFCGECGARLVSSGGRHGSKSVSYLVCQQHRVSANTCKGVRIQKEKLANIILERLHHLCGNYMDEEFQTNLLMQLSKRKKQNALLRKRNVEDMKESIDNLQEQIRQIYSDKLDGIISREEYVEYKQLYSNKIQQQEKQLAEEQQKLLESNVYEKGEHTITLVEKYKNADTLTHAYVSELVKKITVSRSKENEKVITIDWKL